MDLDYLQSVCRDALFRAPLRSWDSRPPGHLTEIYIIFERVGPEDVIPIYVGRGQIQRRLNDHFGGYDGQPIGNYLRPLGGDSRNARFFVTWQEEPNHQCVERDWIDCVCSAVGFCPHYNFKEGDRC